MQPLGEIVVKKATRLRKNNTNYVETFVWVGPKNGLTALFKIKESNGFQMGIEPLHIRGSMWDCNRKFYLSTKNYRNIVKEKIGSSDEETNALYGNYLADIGCSFERNLTGLDPTTKVNGVCAFAASKKIVNGVPDLGDPSGTLTIQWSNDVNCFLTEFFVYEGSYLTRKRDGVCFHGKLKVPSQILCVLDQNGSSFEAYGDTYEQSYEMKYISTRMFSHVVKLGESEISRLAEEANNVLEKTKLEKSWEAPGNHLKFGIVEGCYYHAMKESPLDVSSGKSMCIWDDNDVAHHVEVLSFEDI